VTLHYILFQSQFSFSARGFSTFTCNSRASLHPLPSHSMQKSQNPPRKEDKNEYKIKSNTLTKGETEDFRTNN